jgi:hypothetical protein
MGINMKDHPHYAQINFSIDVFKVNQDGSLDPCKVTKEELEVYGITNNAVFGIDGFNLDDCINKLKQVLGGLKYAE